MNHTGTSTSRPRERHPREDKPLEVAGVYLHVGNSGATFSVRDEGCGPVVRVESSSFGNLNLDFRVATDCAGLRALRDMLDKALAVQDYSPDYVHVAEYSDPNTPPLGEAGSTGEEAGNDWGGPLYGGRYA